MQDLRAEAEDSVSILVSWRSPAQPNGIITQYRLQVLVEDVLLQDITLTAEMVSQTSQLCEATLCVSHRSSVPGKFNLTHRKVSIKLDHECLLTFTVHIKKQCRGTCEENVHRDANLFYRGIDYNLICMAQCSRKTSLPPYTTKYSQYFDSVCS